MRIFELAKALIGRFWLTSIGRPSSIVYLTDKGIESFCSVWSTYDLDYNGSEVVVGLTTLLNINYVFPYLIEV